MEKMQRQQMEQGGFNFPQGFNPYMGMPMMGMPNMGFNVSLLQRIGWTI
jgi:hypothetical protein